MTDPHPAAAVRSLTPEDQPDRLPSGADPDGGVMVPALVGMAVLGVILIEFATVRMLL